MTSTTDTTDIAEIKAAANAWWVRLDSEDITAREQAEFDRWLNTNPQHRQAFDEVCALWDELDAVKQSFNSTQPGSNLQLGKPFSNFTLTGGLTKIKRRKHNHLPNQVNAFSSKLWPAPVLIACCLALWLFSPLPMLLRADYHTGFGERRDIPLSDGSIAHLNGNSALTVTIDDKRRQLTLLQGEAWFEVSPDKTRPFRVHAEHGTVTALGTAFNIRLRDSHAEVSVTQHTVAIDVEQSGDRTQHAVLNEGEQLVYDHHAGLGNIKAIDSQTVTAWQRGKLVFENQPLGEVVAELNRYHRGYLLISDDNIAQRRVNGVFRSDQPLVVLSALENSLQLHSTRLNDYLILLHR